MFVTWLKWLRRNYDRLQRRPRNPVRAKSRPWVEPLESRMVLSTFTVTNTNDSGPGSLRDAIINLDADTGSTIDTIAFSINSGAQTIIPLSPFPSITHPVIMDGTTQPGFAGTPIVELDGASAGSSANGLTIDAGGSTVMGLVINRFSQDGILLETNGNNSIHGNYIGTDLSGTQPLGNGLGIEIDTAGNTVGGTTTEDRNVISGNGGNGILLNGSSATGNIVEGNYIGTDISGSHALGNGANGVVVLSGSQNLIGGTVSGSGNLISANAFSGVGLASDATANMVEGNFVGTDATGTVALGNGSTGVAVVFSFNNIIGGTAAGAGNLISANGFAGVLIFVESENNLVQGNFIGTDITGTHPLGNGEIGVLLELSAGFNIIGGTSVAARNIISANHIEGIELCSTFGNLIEGNYIGTDVTGTVALGNTTYGVDVQSASTNNTIGGAAAGAGNLIAGNGSDGILLRPGASTTLLQGNLIGTDATGTHPVDNGGNGVRVFGASATTIGGTETGAGNLISGNALDGIRIQGASNVVVQDNKIGTDASGTLVLGNGDNGLNIDGSNNTIGGAGLGNVIAFNALDGVFVDSGTGNLISENSIFSNGGLGIDLNAANNANNSQAAPVLTVAVSVNGTITIRGTLTSTPNTTFTIEFFSNTQCDPSGQTFLGSITLMTDSDGRARFVAKFAVAVPPGQFITATATDPNNNTSEFSNCQTVHGNGQGDAPTLATLATRAALASLNHMQATEPLQMIVTVPRTVRSGPQVAYAPTSGSPAAIRATGTDVVWRSLPASARPSAVRDRLFADWGTALFHDGVGRPLGSDVGRLKD